MAVLAHGVTNNGGRDFELRAARYDDRLRRRYERRAVPELKKMGFRSIINVRRASEAGADVEAEGVTAWSAGLRYVDLPFDSQSPDRMLIEIHRGGDGSGE